MRYRFIIVARLPLTRVGTKFNVNAEERDPENLYDIHCKSYFFLLQAERLADYGRLLGGSQPALNGRRRDLDRIQELFPQDYLGLHESEPNSTYHVVSTQAVQIGNICFTKCVDTKRFLNLSSIFI